jgi:hypothetical protein
MRHLITHMDDFGTGLRAHLGLDADQLEPSAADDTVELEQAPVVEAVAVAPAEPDTERLDALAALEAELHERERVLALRESVLASRAGALLAAAQSLYDEVMGGAPSRHDDELALLRQRKSMP